MSTSAARSLQANSASSATTRLRGGPPSGPQGPQRGPRRDFSEAVEKITLGPARHILLNPVDPECTAYHESGHALLGLLVPGSDPVHRVAHCIARHGARGNLSAPDRRSHQLRRGLSPRAHAGGLVQSPGTRCCVTPAGRCFTWSKPARRFSTNHATTAGRDRAVVPDHAAREGWPHLPSAPPRRRGGRRGARAGRTA